MKANYGKKAARLSLPRVGEQPETPDGRSPTRPDEDRYLMEAANGMLVSVPASKAEGWARAQETGEKTLSDKSLQQIKDGVRRLIYGR